MLRWYAIILYQLTRIYGYRHTDVIGQSGPSAKPLMISLNRIKWIRGGDIRAILRLDWLLSVIVLIHPRNRIIKPAIA